jgi:hypothetical protein
LTGQGCVIEPPASKYTQRISFKKFIVRVVDEFEWNRACMAAEDRVVEFAEKKVREDAELEADREEAIKDRPQAAQRPKSMLAMNGAVSVYRARSFTHIVLTGVTLCWDRAIRARTFRTQ